MLGDYPKEYMISSGVGRDENELVAFDAALIDANISNYNLLRVSSILPKKCTPANKVAVEEGAPLLVAYGTISSGEEGEIIASAVAIGLPKDIEKVGVIMEYSGKCDAEYAEKTVKKMVERAMGNHKIEVDKIIASSIDAKVEGKEIVSVISAVSMW